MEQRLEVFDHVLAEADAHRMLSWLDTLSYRSVHQENWRTVWRLLEGMPLRGPTWTTDGESESNIPPPLAPLVTALSRLAQNFRQGYRVSLTPWLYPSGTALGLHRDDGDFDGSFVYYLTREWDVHWGGLLGTVIEAGQAPKLARAILDPSVERRSVALSGQGQWIAPAWNRLVLIPSDVRHFISRVDITAGDRVRISIGGFFHRPKQPYRSGRNLSNLARPRFPS